MDSNSSPTKIWVIFFLISGSRSDLIYLLSFLEFSNMPMFLISQMNCHDPYFEFDDFSNLDELEEEEEIKTKLIQKCILTPLDRNARGDRKGQHALSQLLRLMQNIKELVDIVMLKVPIISEHVQRYLFVCSNLVFIP
jgi:hypothetical protein